MIASVKPKVKVVVQSEEKLFVPSKYQAAIFEWVLTGQGNAAISAVAGSGKSKTLIEISKLIEASGNVLFCAFNKHIADELARKLPNTVTVKTIHSLGNQALSKHLGRTKLNSYKYSDLCSDAANRTFLDHNAIKKNQSELRDTLAELLRFTMADLTDTSDVEQMRDLCSHFGIDTSDWQEVLLFETVAEIQKQGESIARDRNEIDFIDMIWLPIVWDLPIATFDWLLIDEAQDLSKCQAELVLKTNNGSSRFVMVGDPYQAIYGFAGASNDSFHSLAAKLNAQQFPLSICYRCPSEHLKLARDIVAHIEASDTAIEGSIESCWDHQLSLKVQNGDYILCRKTAPLVKACIKLISSKVAAKVMGRDISKALTKIISDLSKTKDFDFNDFQTQLSEFVNRKVEKLQKKKNTQGQIDSLLDRMDGIIACYKAFEVSDAKQLIQQIDQLFSNDESTVTLCTVHRAKGLEGKRVFILEPKSMPLVWKDQQPWELIQEMNLKYVALTRSKEYLCFVHPQK